MEPTAFTVTAAECDCGDCDGQHGHTRILGGDESDEPADESDGAETGRDLPPLEDLAAELGVPVDVLEALDEYLEVVEALDTGGEPDDEPDASVANMGVLSRDREGDPDGGDGERPPAVLTGARETDPEGGGDGLTPRGFMEADGDGPDGEVPPSIVTGDRRDRTPARRDDEEPDVTNAMGVLTRESDRE